jgi:hypothetical protein
MEGNCLLVKLKSRVEVGQGFSHDVTSIFKGSLVLLINSFLLLDGFRSKLVDGTDRVVLHEVFIKCNGSTKACLLETRVKFR